MTVTVRTTNPDHIERARQHGGLSHPDRVSIMDHIASAPTPPSVSAIAAAVGISQVDATRHLIKLRSVGLLAWHQERATVYNRLADGVVWPCRLREVTP